MALKFFASEIFKKGLEAVLPFSLIRNNLRVTENILTIGSHTYQLKNNVYIVGFGKAVLGMGKAVEEILQGHVQSGILSIPTNLHNSLKLSPFEEAKNMMLKLDSVLVTKEGAHNNLPDEDAKKSATEIEHLVKSLDENDILIVLISGGGSALLPAPVPEISLYDKVITTQLLASRGCTIEDLNTVRKKLSRLKGGKMAGIVKCKSVITLILSDIINDPLDLIASGPTVQDHSTFAEFLEILQKYSVEDEIPKSVKEFLHSKCISETDNTWNSCIESSIDFSNIQNVIIGNNITAIYGCKEIIETSGFSASILSTKLAGNVKDIAHSFTEILNFFINDKELNEKLCFDKSIIQNAYQIFKTENKICLISAGEPTVTVTGSGKGGRNQELVLQIAASFKISNDESKGARYLFCFLSAGTDGQDGPTIAAGAYFTEEFHEKVEKQKVNLKQYLDNNGSYDFFKELDNGSELLVIGLTGTNVMDIQILLIEKLLI